MPIRLKSRSPLPGFGLTLGYSLLYLSLIVLLPLATLPIRSAALSWADFLAAISDARAVASYRLTLGTAFAAAAANALFGFIVAWALVRYRFPGRRLLDAFVDLPFAMPTAVSGIALTNLYASTGWLGRWLEPAGIKAAFTPLGITIALTFIGLPFVVRSVQPALQEVDLELEDAAATLGANRWQTFRRVILPAVVPSLITGFALAFARALGEYGSVVFIAGNMPLKTEITSLLIIVKLEQYDYAGAAAIACVMLAASFTILFAINLLQWWVARRHRGTT
jgi:sulfate transport system permease protein